MEEKTFWQHARFFIITWIIAMLISLMFFLVGVHAEEGTASYYTKQSAMSEGTSGIYTASGELFDENALTCAMRSREWGKLFKVTNLANNKSVIVRLNDFGPNKKLHKKRRIVDLSKGAFEKIADLKQGVIKVKIEEV